MGVPAVTAHPRLSPRAGGGAPPAALPKPLALERPRRVRNGSRIRGAAKGPLKEDCLRFLQGLAVPRCPWGSFCLARPCGSPQHGSVPRLPPTGSAEGSGSLRRERPGSCRGSAARGRDGKPVPGSGRAGPWLSLRGPLAPSQGRWCCSRGKHLSHRDGQSPPLLQPLPVNWLVPTMRKDASNPTKDEPPQLSPSWLEQTKMCWKGPLLSKKGYQNLSYLNFQLRKVKDLRGQEFNYCKKLSRNLQNDILFHDELMCIPRPTFNPGAAGWVC